MYIFSSHFVCPAPHYTLPLPLPLRLPAVSARASAAAPDQLGFSFCHTFHARERTMAEQAGLTGDHTSLYMEKGSHTHTLAHTHVQGRHWGVVVVSDLSPTLTLSGLSTTWQHLEATMKYLCSIYRETLSLSDSLCHAQPHSVSIAHTHTLIVLSGISQLARGLH